MSEAVLSNLLSGLFGGLIGGVASFTAIRIEMKYLRRDVDLLLQRAGLLGGKAG